ncbi:MAG: response regulator transcription factor [Prolixibacteraceae bacterium]|nr:response regulator transcription factor [Prolixibacteraceae bacterium]MBN2648140.1 response regulator transcription factor [Prolixibacteraceae bacterium]
MENRKYKIIIIDDNQAYIDAIKFLFSKRNDIEVIGEANDGVQFLKLIETVTPDLVLMDIILPGIDGIKLAKMAGEFGHDLKFLGLTMSDNPLVHTQMYQNGFVAGILKSHFFEDFDITLRMIENNETYFPVLN